MKNIELFTSFNDKIKLRMKSPEFDSPKWVKYIDKLKFKEYAKKMNIDSPKTLFVINNINKLSLKDIPANCVIKTNHASARNIIIKNGKIIGGNIKNLDLVKDWDLIKQRLKRWLDPYNIIKEPQYKYITPKIYVEELLEPSPTEIKLLVINGKVKLLYIFDNTIRPPCRQYLDTNWNPIDCSDSVRDTCYRKVEKPDNWRNIIKVAERLSDNIDFVRIDLFLHNGKILAGEYTLTPDAGKAKIKQEKWDKFLSNDWKI
jgi:hypothetical protein